MAEAGFRIALRQQEDYRFAATFDQSEVPPLVTDESPPLGASAGPDPSRLLGVAVANCLAASLLFALRKFGNEPSPLQASADVTMARNDAGRLRIPRIDVVLHLGVPWQRLKHADRALAQFEDFCTVTQSVRGAIQVEVQVLDSNGAPSLAP
jgi:Predicted redox protein, regulator of disulfide bond formation